MELNDFIDKKLIKKQYKDFHKRFASGEQNIRITSNGVIEVIPNNYFWEEKEIYNIIFPIVEMIKEKYPQVTTNDIYGEKGLVSLLVPLQRAYNAIKNAGIQIIKSNGYPTLCVEDGSVDIENIEEEGLAPGKVIVYRQGANAPTLMTHNNISETFLQQQEESIMRDYQAVINAFMSKMEKKYNVQNN